MEVLCQDGWHISPNDVVKAFSVPPNADETDPLPEKIKSTVKLPTELENLPFIDPPEWIFVGGTGYLEIKGFVHPKKMINGQFEDPFGRKAFIYNEMLIFQRRPNSQILCADFINNPSQNYSNDYPTLVEWSYQKPVNGIFNPWGYPYAPVTTIECPKSFQVDEFGYLSHSEEELKNFPERFLTLLADGRIVTVNKDYIKFQRWIDRYVMVSIYR
jgi:hypothetical protein